MTEMLTLSEIERNRAEEEAEYFKLQYTSLLAEAEDLKARTSFHSQIQEQQEFLKAEIETVGSELAEKDRRISEL